MPQLRLKIVSTFFMDVDTDYYKTLDLNTIEEMVDFEKAAFEDGVASWDLLERGKTQIEVVSETE